MLRCGKLEKGGGTMTVNWVEVVSLVLNALFISGGLTLLITIKPTRQKASADADHAKADADKAQADADKTKVDVETHRILNDEKVSQLLMEMIVKPLKTEINALRKDVRNLQRAISKISDCPHADDCPVRRELQNDKGDNKPEQ